MQLQTIEKKGKNVDEAIKTALEELDCTIEEVTIEVLEEASKALLGLIKRPAIVRVSVIPRPEQEASKVVEELLDKMKIDYKIDKIEWDSGRVRINITGEDMGLLIGRRGETLNAVQFLASLIINRKRDERINLVLDVEDYRKKREQSLEALALRLSDKVKDTKKNVVMRPMNSRERRIIHTVLQGDSMITTYSTGEEPNRKVVIALKK
ncbi:MAG TPA: RNA-binding cell elongation regulator Jag/EloR [Syntrophomonadaceae bacterium]|nr:RNA-binding cell elongation regulator Jag/EloR [Syntrophomonadaceae bacterium]